MGPLGLCVNDIFIWDECKYNLINNMAGGKFLAVQPLDLLEWIRHHPKIKYNVRNLTDANCHQEQSHIAVNGSEVDSDQ